MLFEAISFATTPQAVITRDAESMPSKSGRSLTTTMLAFFATPKFLPATFEATQVPWPNSSPGICGSPGR